MGAPGAPTVWAFCNGTIQPLEGDNDAADGPRSLWLALSHTLSVTGGVFPLVSQKKHMSTPQEAWSVWRAACHSPQSCFYALEFTAFILFSPLLSHHGQCFWRPGRSWFPGNLATLWCRWWGQLIIFLSLWIYPRLVSEPFIALFLDKEK